MRGIVRQHNEKVVDGLVAMGIDLEMHEHSNPNALVPGVWLDAGKVHVCPWSAHLGDILHETGHWAIIPSRFRPLITPGNLEKLEFFEAIETYIKSKEAFDRGPDHWLIRAIIQMGDHEAQAWSFAAAIELGLNTREIFCHRYPGVPDEHQPFQGEGEQEWACLRIGQHAGIHGLQAAGMCRVRDWPKMIRWVQD